MYPPMVSGKRSGAVAAGILMIIAGSLALICGLIYPLDDWWYWDAWFVLAAMCFVSFGLSLVGAMGLFRRRWRMAVVMACVTLILVGGFTLPDFTILSVIILVLGIVSIVLVGTSWTEFHEPMMAGYPYPQMMPPMGAGRMPPPGMALPPGMAPPPGMTPSPGITPPPGGPSQKHQWGAQPPRMAPTPLAHDQGAPPPPTLPLKEEEVVAYVEIDDQP